MASDKVDDFTFIMTCIKHSSEKLKVDFEEVAKELGAKGSKACYQRHWGMMRKFMSDSNANRQKASKSVVSGTATPKKRARGTKAEVKKEVCEIADKDENDDVGSDATISDVETPTKRVKGEY